MKEKIKKTLETATDTVASFFVPAAKTPAPAPTIPKIRDAGIQRLKLLITVVDRSKANYYLDMIEGYEVNFQTVMYGAGTADSKLGYVGLSESEKAVILSVVREDKVKAVCAMLEEKFARVKNGKGIAFTVPFGSVMGVHAYCFLSNSKSERKGV